MAHVHTSIPNGPQLSSGAFYSQPNVGDQMHVTPSPMAELSPRMRSLASSLSRWKMRVMRTRSRSSMLLLRASRDCRCASLATSSCRGEEGG